MFRMAPLLGLRTATTHGCYVSQHERCAVQTLSTVLGVFIPALLRRNRALSVHLERAWQRQSEPGADALGGRLHPLGRGCLLAPVGYGARGVTRQIAPASTAM